MPPKLPPKPSPSIGKAIEVFVYGYAFARSFTHPYEPHRVENLWVVRDAPRKKPADYRREEWVVRATDAGAEAATVDQIIRRHTRGHFCICAIRKMDEPDAPIRAAYKSIGYRLGGTESLMVHPLARIPKLPEPFPVERVMTQELADRLNKAAGQRQIHPAHFAPDSPLRQYAAIDAGNPVGWARSIAAGDSTWVQSMYVLPAYRRRGIGKSILANLLRDDRVHGSTASYLLASHAGALLYPHVGYEQIGQLLLFTPKK